MQNDPKEAADKQQSSTAAPENAAAPATNEEKDADVTGTEQKAESHTDKPTRSELIISLLTWIFRIAFGATFIVSGTAKALDPWGTIYKMHDYIAAMPDGLFGWVMPLLTPCSFMLFTIEILIGLSIITGSYRRLAPIGSLLIMLFMTPLTLWIALKNPVADCGCFGDAFTLTNWQTFWKNVALTAMAVWLLLYNKRARCLILPTMQWLMTAGTLAFSIAVGFISYSIQPMIDFRPYPAGTNLIEAGSADTGNEADTLMAIWQRGEERITIPADSIPEGDDWEFIERVEPSRKASEQPKTETKPAKGLAIFDGPEDITEEAIPGEGEAVVVFMTGLPDISSGNFYKLNSLYTYCQNNDVAMVAVAAATPLEISDFIDLSLAEYTIYTAEDTAIKEVVRGNPALVYLQDGKIVWKSSLSAIPTYDFMESTPQKPGALASSAPIAGKSFFKTLCLIFAGFILLIMLLSHVPMVIRFMARKFLKSRWVKDGAAVKAVITVLAGSMLLTSCSEDEPEMPQQPATDDERTILIYMVATNTLNSDSRDDIEEILRGYEALNDDINTNILIYRTSYSSDIPTLSIVTEDKYGRAMLKELHRYNEATSSVSPYRIGEVINDMKRYAPANDYGLFLWSHATSWLPSNSPEPLDAARAPMHRAFGDDYGKSISITELADAIPRDTFSFIWMDCCLMGGIEIVYQLRNHCRNIVAYPTEILAGGAPYDKILPYLATRRFSLEKAAQATFDYYNNKIGDMRSCTVSVIDTSALPSVAEEAHKIIAEGNVIQIAAGIQTYGHFRGVYFYDFNQVYTTLAGSNEQAAQMFTERLNDAILLKLSTPKFLNITIDTAHFSGLSCYIPGFSRRPDYEEFYQTLDWYKDVYK